MAFIELDQREALTRDHSGERKPVSLDTFRVIAISKASPSATHINLQNARAESAPVFYCIFTVRKKKKRPEGKASSKFPFPVNHKSDDLFQAFVLKELSEAWAEQGVNIKRNKSQRPFLLCDVLPSDPGANGRSSL